MELFLLKFSACLLVFWLTYVLFLEKQQMHHFKRFYLLGSFAMALIIPQLTIIEYIEPIVQNFEITTAFIPIEAEVMPQPIETSPVLTLETILWSIYILGATLFAIRFAVNLFRLYRQIATNDKQRNRNFIYVLLKAYRIPHSFFKYIFVNQQQFENNQIPEEVRLHEETHAKQWHSLDILLLELLQIIFWFHPLVYILKHHIKLNHEFLADDAVLQQGVTTKNYQNILLQFSSNTHNHQLASAINYSSFKKRFTVMKTQTSKTRIWLSTLLVLPVLAILFYSFAEREYVEKEQTNPVDAITEELKEANKLKMTYVNGATDAMMQEYIAWIEAFERTNFINNTTYQRIVAIYDIMNNTQRNSVKKYPEVPTINLSKVEPKSPSKIQFESWKDETVFALWLDGKHIENSILNDYSHKDIVYYTGSKVLNNAMSKTHPQPYQFNLYTKTGFKSTYQDSQIKRYEKISKVYSNAITEYLKGPQTDNSELFILKAQADKIYNSFTKEELKEHNILPCPPVPAKNYNGRTQQKATKEQIAEYNTWAKKMNSAIKKAEATNNKSSYPIIKKKEYDKYYKIYRNLMSEAQRENAEPWPNIPPPPPPAPPTPETPKKTSKGGPNANGVYQTNKIEPIKIYIDSDNNIQLNGKSIKEDAINNQVAKLNKHLSTDDHRKYVMASIAIEKNKSAELAKSIQTKLKEVNVFCGSISYLENVSKSNLPKKSLNLYSGLTVEEAKAKEKKIFNTSEDSLKKTDNTNDNSPWKVKMATASYEYTDDNGNSTGKIYLDQTKDTPPESTLDFVIRMAKEGAKFFSEGQPISSDDAIALIKKNDQLNVNAREKSKDGKSLVYITKKPIIIDTKVGKDNPKLQKSILPKVNGESISSPKLKMTKKEFKKLKLSTEKGKVKSFKVKIPGIETEFIEGNTITKTTLSNLAKANNLKMIPIFDIKDEKGSNVAPLIIELTD
ncbi:M56 family metallopeptidase [uncultured Winogradskyella sp.]|uniref:M56 family metallopeptidase n=1 Tax=uncultured Winogradskyella sp. TaxID=395353 RepID=UPI00262989AC|nr:M56 family metallopeptidase [uncultured Winogradskyella sp.]